MTSDEIDELLGRVANEYFDLISRGTPPQIDDFASDYPQFADLIRHVFPLLHLLYGSASGDSGDRLAADGLPPQTSDDVRRLRDCALPRAGGPICPPQPDDSRGDEEREDPALDD